MVNIWPRPQRRGAYSSFTYEDTKQEEREVAELREKLSKLKIVAQARVTGNRVYCAQYHPEKSKDLIFFGGNVLHSDRPQTSLTRPTDKHGQLGIWDPRAPADEVGGTEKKKSKQREDGKCWRLQVHWPPTSRSSISCIRFDPTNLHTVGHPNLTVGCFSVLQSPRGIDLHKLLRLHDQEPFDGLRNLQGDFLIR